MPSKLAFSLEIEPQMIPLFILVTPIGFFLFIKKLNPDKLTLIVTSVFLSIPAFYAYSYPLLETRYLYFLFPIFCIFAILRDFM